MSRVPTRRHELQPPGDWVRDGLCLKAVAEEERLPWNAGLLKANYRGGVSSP